MSIVIETTDWQSSSKPLTEVRFTVFVHEQNVPEEMEIDEEDATAIHFLALDSKTGQAIGTARLLANGYIGRMAVLKNWRGLGVGMQLLQAAVETARQAGMKSVFLNAQVYATGFYEKAGFIAEGEIFKDAGIDHVHMHRPN